jgi:tyrosyl-tRNA synthetase
MCTPLLVKADGGKFGKTESGTIWLDSEMTSPYAFYQFWINTDDRDLELMLKTFSLKSLSEIEQLMNISNAEPNLRHGQKALAMEMTSLVHSEQAMLDAQNAASALFAGGDLSDINKSTLHAALQEAGLAKSILINNQMPSVVELLLSSGVVGSKNEAKRAISEGSIWINQTRISTEDQAVAVSELIHGAYLVVRKGKKTIRGLEF